MNVLIGCERSGVVREAFRKLGHNASKKTGLWLKNLPPLMLNPQSRVIGRMVTHKGKTVERFDNQTDSGQNRLSPGEDRWMDRSRTYQGIADAMALQWGGWL